MSAPAYISVVCPVVVGRAPQLASIEHLVAQVEAGHAVTPVLLIGSEAGLGKSRLVAELKGHVTRSGWNTVQGSCFEPDQALPYAPVIDLLQTFAATRSAHDTKAVFGLAASDLRKLLPELGDLLPKNEDLPLEPIQEQRRLFHALAQFCMRLAAAQPLAIVIEDLHWSDAVTLDWLIYFARHAAAQRLLLVLTYRTNEASPSLLRFLAELDRSRLATELLLGKLTREDVGAMLRATFSFERPVRPPFLDTLYTLTEGNPFFIEEMLKALMMDEAVNAHDLWRRSSLSEIRIPRSVQDAVRRRTEYVSQAARDTLTLAAVIGRRFDFALLQQVTGHDELELVRLLKELISAQLVVETANDQFAFRHALAREAIYNTLLERERRVLHRRLAATLEQEQLDARVADLAYHLDARVADLAYHYFAAAIWEKAWLYSQRAAVQARRLYASHEVIAQATRALEAARHLFAVPLAPLYHERGQAYETLGDFSSARSDYEAALRTARAVGSQRDEWQALLDLGFLWSSRGYKQSGAYLEQLLDLARAMGDDGLLAASLNRVGNWQLNLDQPLAARRYHQEALDLFQKLNDRFGRAATLGLLGITHYLSGNMAQGTAYFKQEIVDIQELDDRQGLVHSLGNLALRAEFDTEVLNPESLAMGTAPVEQAVQLAREMNWRAGEAFALINLASALSTLGEYGRAFDAVHRGLVIAEEIEHHEFMIQARATLGRLHLAILQSSEAVHHLEQGLSMAQASGLQLALRVVACVLVMAYVQQRTFDRAEALLAASSGAGEDVATRPSLMVRQVQAAGVELALARGDGEQALQRIEHLIACTANLGQSIVPRLWALWGEALMLMSRYSEAEERLSIALDTAREQGRRPLLWRIQLALGNLYMAQKRHDAAAHSYGAAQTIIGELGATIGDQAMREHFERHARALIPERTPMTPRQAAKQAFDGLTDREREVAILIAQGLSNRQIAQRLVLSERTVTTHIGNILSKLDLTSRTQIARWAIDKGLITP
jgi:DNA-binding CsgD family transcriptional regulator